jgi:TetR/AcrR family transcriptional repressor of nem operon
MLVVARAEQAPMPPSSFLTDRSRSAILDRVARPREFDRDVALDRAMALFWARGYEATSIEDLIARMGIQRGSLYATFGDKRALFLAALDRYERVVARQLFDALETPGSGLAAIHRFFRAKVVASLDRGRPPGCLVTNSVVELARRDRGAAARVGASLGQLEDAFRRALARARAAGEIEPGRDLRALARFLTSSAQGLSVMARTCPERQVLEDIVEVVLAALAAGAPARPGRARASRGEAAERERSRTMASRIQPVTPGESSDPALKELLTAGAEGWWRDAQMFGVIGRVPALLKSIVPVFVGFFGGGRIDAHLFELMRLKTGQINDCAY